VDEEATINHPPASRAQVQEIPVQILVLT